MIRTSRRPSSPSVHPPPAEVLDEGARVTGAAGHLGQRARAGQYRVYRVGRRGLNRSKGRDVMSATGSPASAMRQTMAGQAEALAGILADEAPVIAVAERLRGRRVLAIGTGTSWHAASQAAALLRAAGLDAWAAQSADAAVDGPLPGEGGLLLAFSHTGTTQYAAQAAQRARARGAHVIQVSGAGVAGADLVTVPAERSSAYTASHLGALARAAQLARALGADLPALAEVPAAVDRAYRQPRDRHAPPARLIEFIGGGINQWTAAEGALKIRETAYVASEGLAVEQFLHGPSVALGPGDRLVCLDGGGHWSARIADVAQAAEQAGVPVTRVADGSLGELLSIFPLTVAVQRIALEAAETLGADPDSFGLDQPGHQGWDRIEL
jgi:glutamine---fructose-6-phosphate transaminase (isomerizing)